MDELQPRLQKVVGDTYIVENELPAGGMSRLFLATERSLNRKVVIKVLPPDMVSAVSAARFKREMEVTAHLQHPHVLPILTAGVAGDVLYYVMPFVRGESLRHRLVREGRLSVGDSVRILSQVAAALDHAHRAGIVHRDVKPENILLSDGQAVLADFGVARALEAARGAGLTGTGFAVGSPGYMAPEQFAGDLELDARVDIYALGVVGYEMVAGAPPFSGSTGQALLAAHLTETPPPLHKVRDDVPDALTNAITRALEKDPSRRFSTAAEFRAALEEAPRGPPHHLTSERKRTRERVALAVAAGVVLAIILIFTRQDRGPALSDDLIVVAPFNVPPGELAFWREGLVDLLSRKLDGAGPIRTVSPTFVVRRLTERANAGSVSALGRAAGARYAVFGDLLPFADSVRASATLLNAETGRPIGDIERVEHQSRIDRLSDSLTVDVLRRLGDVRPVGVVRYTALSTTSLPALKAFLQGEQHYRRAQWDSALTSYERALEQDTTFVLAMRRLENVIEWREALGASRALELAARSSRGASGLSGHDSLLAVSDSLRFALFGPIPDGDVARRLDRAFALRREATRRYPLSAEAWYALGEGLFHFASTNGRTSEREVLATFDRAIELDSAFAPAYVHPIELVFRDSDIERAHGYTRRYLAQQPTDTWADAVRLLHAALNTGRGAAATLIASIDTTTLLEPLEHLRGLIWRWPDSSQVSVRLSRRRLTLDSARAPERSAQSGARRTLVHMLSYRGRPREAFAVSGSSLSNQTSPGSLPQFLELAMFGAVPHDSAARAFDRALREEPLHPMRNKTWGLPWWAMARDTVSIRRLIRDADSIASRDTFPALRAFGDLVGKAARGYLALSQQDTASALRYFTSYPDSLVVCFVCNVWRLTRAQLLAASGTRDREAAELLSRWYWYWPTGGTVLWELERGRVAERMGNRAAAIDSYAFVAAAWANAEPDLQSIVQEVRRALERLQTDRAR